MTLGLSLTQPLHKALRERPCGIFTVCDQRRRTNEEFVGRVERLASGLVALGLKPGDRVAMLALNSDRFVEYVFATLWAGGVINPVNARWSPLEMAFSLEDSGTAMLIVDDTFAPLIPELKAQAPILESI
ncbi:AMP-binding protein, partial [Rhizobiaceae sp. 2RAB30]